MFLNKNKVIMSNPVIGINSTLNQLQNNPGKINYLPEESISHIFSFLNAKELSSVSQTNKSMHTKSLTTYKNKELNRTEKLIQCFMDTLVSNQKNEVIEISRNLSIQNYKSIPSMNIFFSNIEEKLTNLIEKLDLTDLQKLDNSPLPSSFKELIKERIILENQVIANYQEFLLIEDRFERDRALLIEIPFIAESNIKLAIALAMRISPESRHSALECISKHLVDKGDRHRAFLVAMLIPPYIRGAALSYVTRKLIDKHLSNYLYDKYSKCTLNETSFNNILHAALNNEYTNISGFFI